MAKPWLPTFVLGAIAAFAFFSIVDLLYRNGWIALHEELLAQDIVLLPGTATPAKTRFTGFAPLDGILETLVRFFWPVVSGELPPLSLYTLYFAGQIVPMHVVLLMEGLRVGNQGTVLAFPAVWGQVYQLIPFGMIIPIYGIVYLYRSPIAGNKANSTTSRSINIHSMDPTRLTTIPMAMVLGYIIPLGLVIFASLSSISIELQQMFLAAWQLFPTWVGLFHYVLAQLFKTRTGANSRSGAASLGSARGVYRQVLFISFLAHVCFLSIAAFPHLLGQWFDSSVQNRISLRAAFMPMSAFSPPTVTSMAEGCLALLQYDLYCACTAALVRVIYMAYVSAGSSLAAGSSALFKAMVRSLFVGPGGAVLWAMWDRDEESLLAAGEKKTQ